jgi:hypothetical protein
MANLKKHNEANDPLRGGDKMRVCSDLLRKQTELMRQIETRANIVIGLSSTAVVFVVNKSGVAGHPLVLPALIITAFAAILFALMALKPPSFLTKKSQSQSIFYHTAIAKMGREKYEKMVDESLSSTDAAVRQYVIETHNLCEHSIKYKKRFAHISITIFTIGLFATVIAWLI